MSAPIRTSFVVAGLLALPFCAHAAGALEGGGLRDGMNIEAIVMFFLFVAGTLAITKWAASRTKSAADFYAAGGGITGFQNGLAIAGGLLPRHFRARLCVGL